MKLIQSIRIIILFVRGLNLKSYQRKKRFLMMNKIHLFFNNTSNLLFLIEMKNANHTNL